MEHVMATATWSPDVDRFTLWAEPPAGRVSPEPFDDDPAAVLLMAIDDTGQDTGRVAGVEIALRAFERWETVPDLPLRWQLPDRPPLSLKDLLQQLQRELRAATAESRSA